MTGTTTLPPLRFRPMKKPDPVVFDFVCPFCKTKNEDVEEAELSSTASCKGCGRRLRAVREGGEIECSRCGFHDECKYCVDDVRIEKLCRADSCKWQQTLAVDVEKCSVCYDIRRTPLPPVSHDPIPQNPKQERRELRPES